jgi:hypothetical protein
MTATLYTPLLLSRNAPQWAVDTCSALNDKAP